jgi:hypothetical protein
MYVWLMTSGIRSDHCGGLARSSKRDFIMIEYASIYPGILKNGRTLFAG